jgi:hypothetical protein
MYLLRINYNGAPVILEVRISGSSAFIEKEIYNPYNRKYEKAYMFDKNYVVSAFIKISKISTLGQSLYSTNLSVLQKIVIDYILGE